MAVIIDRLLQVLSYFAVTAIIALSLVPGSARPQTGAPGQGEHVVAYLLTAVLFGLRSPARPHLLKIAIVFVAGAAALEAAQGWVPGRNSQVGDFVASSIGILAGLAIGAALAPLYAKWRDRLGR